MPKGVYERAIIPAEVRFWNFIDNNGRVNKDIPEYKHLTQCWSWTGSKVDGYGQLSVDRKTILAHRFSYYLHHPLTMDINDIDLYVCHKCDNPECTNPEHLFLGSSTDNNRDRVKKGRGKKDRNIPKGEQNHFAKLTESQVIEIRKKYAEGNTSQQKIADEYGVSKTTIRFIIILKNWKHI